MTSIGAGAIIDQYTLIRAIGRGGFGTVWLARSPVLNAYVALKIIAVGAGNESARELKAVQAYKKLGVAGLASGLLPVEHVGVVGGMIFYVMPLADGTSSNPEDEAWKPLTLGSLIEEYRSRGAWFSSQEIISYFTAICKAVQILSEAGLVHRDIKPDNILFMRGRAVLSDISLLTTDASQSAFYGTPGFLAPSWYVESGGQIDMFSIAATLFTVLTGQSPDKMGRALFIWPPSGKDSLLPSEQHEWRRLHRVALRATHEKAEERYHDFAKLGQNIHRDEMPEEVRPDGRSSRLKPRGVFKIPWLCAGGGVVLVVVFFAIKRWSNVDIEVPVVSRSEPKKLEIAKAVGPVTTSITPSSVQINEHLKQKSAVDAVEALHAANSNERSSFSGAITKDDIEKAIAEAEQEAIKTLTLPIDNELASSTLAGSKYGKIIAARDKQLKDTNASVEAYAKLIREVEAIRKQDVPQGNAGVIAVAKRVYEMRTELESLLDRAGGYDFVKADNAIIKELNVLLANPTALDQKFVGSIKKELRIMNGRRAELTDDLRQLQADIVGSLGRYISDGNGMAIYVK